MPVGKMKRANNWQAKTPEAASFGVFYSVSGGLDLFRLELPFYFPSSHLHM